MDDIISRQAAINALIRKRQPVNNGDGTITITMMTDEVIRDVLNELPSVQPQRMRGRWTIYGGKNGVYCCDCSECGNTCSYQFNFCPNCGADMRETE